MAANVLESIDALFSPITDVEIPKVELEKATHANDLEDLDKYIDNEIELRKTAIGMTWRKLDKCFKWQAIQTHLESAGIGPEDELYKRAEELMKSNDLATSVEYNKEEKKIVRINHPDFKLLEIGRE